MRYLVAVLFAVFFAGSALAGQCPALAHQIDERMQSVQLDADTKARIQELRDQGQSLHSQGKHGESVRVLKQAMSELDAAS